ncbi:MAG: septum formation initiator family protein [Candidatus Zixiibacteriota bacterium]
MMPGSERRNKKKSVFAPIKQNFVNRLSNTDARARRNIFRIFGVVVAVFLLYSFFSGDCGFIRIAKLHIQKHRLINTNQELLVELVDAEITTNRLLNDLNYIEYIARTKHFLSKPGETIYRLRQ